jgi:hypothetical protein
MASLHAIIVSPLSRAQHCFLHEDTTSAGRRIELAGVSRLYKTPRILDDRVTLAD